MKYKHNEDEWNVDGLRDRLFGKGKTISIRYSPEFVKEYSSADEDSDFTLRKSHNTLTLSSNEEFAFLTAKELNGICDRVYDGKKNGTYCVVYHFKNLPDEFFVANSILNEIVEMNRGSKIRHDYKFPEQDLPETT